MKISKIAKKVASLLGEDKDTSTSSVKHRSLKKTLVVDCPSFSSILPYRYFWQEKNLFINEHSIGFGLELTVFSGADEKLVNSISDLLRHEIGDEMDLQFIVWGSNHVGVIVYNAYKYHMANDDIYSELAKVSSQYYKKGAQEGFKNKLNLPTALREYRLFVFLSKNTPYNDQAVADIEAARDDFTVELESAGIGFIDIILETFLPLLRSWINPEIKDVYPGSVKHEEHTTLNEQVVDKSFELINGQERLTIEVDSKSKRNGENSNQINNNQRIQTKITNLSIRTLPDEFALWQSADNFFNVFRASQAIRCPFLISMHARLIPQVDAKSKAQSMYLGMDKKARSAYAKYISGTQETAMEW